jgi:hypothetical protein
MGHCRCGNAISFRYIDGRLVPLGCQCYGGHGRRRSLGRSLDVQKPWTCGFGIVPWALSYRTQCFWCSELVFYHTNGYGDCVLLDELAPPWPVHPCWEQHRQGRRRAVIESTIAIEGSGVRSERLGLSEDWLAHMEGSLPNQSWWRHEPERRGLAVQTLKEYHLTAPPRPVDVTAPGPYLVLNWVRSRAEISFYAPDMPVLEAGWSGVTTGIQGLTVFVPRDLAVQLKVGDPIVAEIEAFGSPTRCAYLAKRLRTQEGGRIDVY